MSKYVHDLNSGAPAGLSVLQGHKYLFQLPAIDTQRALAIADAFNLSMPIAHVLLARGFTTDDAIRAHLFSTYERDVAHPSRMAGAEAAVARLLRAVKSGEKILIFGDYDVDGITSSALVLRCLLPLGARINYFLPNRVRDGYGLSVKAVRKAKQAGYDLILTVDNGITAFEAAAEARTLGIDLIITDHHRQHDHLPDALAVVNPNQDACAYPFKGLSGVGVIFKILSLFYEKEGLTLPEKAYELLLLGTIADVMPLLSENRYWVQYGLHKVNTQRSYALRVMMNNGKLTKEALSSLDIGFMIAPQLNALGRLADCREGVKFLISSQRDDVDRVGAILLEMNEERKKVERAIYEEICRIVDAKQINLERENVIIATGHDWPTGVIGLVAGKLMHHYGRPTLLFHEQKDGLLKGSCRSIKEFNIFDALYENRSMLKSFGGHSCAAGLSLHKKDLPMLKERLEQKITAELTPFQLLQKLGIDAEISLPEVGHQLLADLAKLEPFGNQNEQPVFLIREVSLLRKPQLLKEKHVRCTLFSHGTIKPAIFFNRPDIYNVLDQVGDRSFAIAAQVTVNEWDGRTSIQLQGIDVAI